MHQNELKRQSKHLILYILRISTKLDRITTTFKKQHKINLNTGKSIHARTQARKHARTHASTNTHIYYFIFILKYFKSDSYCSRTKSNTIKRLEHTLYLNNYFCYTENEILVNIDFCLSASFIKNTVYSDCKSASYFT